jgi:hypothetical protein
MQAVVEQLNGQLQVKRLVDLLPSNRNGTKKVINHKLHLDIKLCVLLCEQRLS